jgi:hypothetical protein
VQLKKTPKPNPIHFSMLIPHQHFVPNYIHLQLADPKKKPQAKSNAPEEKEAKQRPHHHHAITEHASRFSLYVHWGEGEGEGEREKNMLIRE